MDNNEVSEFTPTTSNTQPVEVSLAQSLIPFRRDDHKARYLGYLACGFSVREALEEVGCTKSSLSLWRDIPTFAIAEQRIPEIRRELSREYISLDFCRNFRLVLEKDGKVLRKSLGKDLNNEGKSIPMTFEENQYLLKMRGCYTPQQLGLLETLIKADEESDGSFSWTKFISENPEVIRLSRTDTVEVLRGKKVLQATSSIQPKPAPSTSIKDSQEGA